MTEITSTYTKTKAFQDLTDLAAEKVGGKALFANDEFFAEKENLLKSGRGVFIPDKYTERGKWMDGWETRRSRQPGYDWCLIQLGIPGVIHGLDVDTNHFLGNYPEHCSVEACYAPEMPSVEGLLSEETRWVEILPKSVLQGGHQNLFEIEDGRVFTHLRLNIFPDGGVARLRVHGKVAPRWQAGSTNEPINLACITQGAEVLLCNDMFFSPKENLILPTRAENMGQGWETRRRRAPGHDWVILKLGAKGYLKEVEVDTAHFKGNFPDQCSIEACLLEDNLPLDFLTSRSIAWTEVLPPQKLQADHIHRFEIQDHHEQLFNYIKLNIFPDGGISRLRIFGELSPLERFQAQPISEIRQAFERCCGSTEWVSQMVQSLPFSSPKSLLSTAERVADLLIEEDWLEAFEYHPQIGDIDALRAKFASTADWAQQEQAGSQNASEDTLKALAEGNQKYLDKFGYIFIVCATGKSADEMLALLNQRLGNDPETELQIAANEQRKITQIRLEKLLNP